MVKQIEFFCPKCKNKLIADVDLDSLVVAKANELLTNAVQDKRTITKIDGWQDSVNTVTK